MIPFCVIPKRDSKFRRMEIMDPAMQSVVEAEAKIVIQIIEQLKNDNARVRSTAMLSIDRIGQFLSFFKH